MADEMKFHARVDQHRARLRDDLDELLRVMREELARGHAENEALATFILEYGMPTLEEDPRLVLSNCCRC